MRIESVEIYSDTTNAAVMRHPGRKFPGILLQGDTLYSLCQVADAVCAGARAKFDAAAFGEVNALRNQLQMLLAHYKAVLEEHHLPIPFNDAAGS